VISGLQGTTKALSSSVRDGRPIEKLRGSVTGSDTGQLDLTGFLGLLQGMMAGGAMHAQVQAGHKPTKGIAGGGSQGIHAAGSNGKHQLGQQVAGDVRLEQTADPAGQGKRGLPGPSQTSAQPKGTVKDDTLGRLPVGLQQQVINHVDEPLTVVPSTTPVLVPNPPRGNKPLARSVASENKPALETTISGVNRIGLQRNLTGSLPVPALSSTKYSSLHGPAKSLQGSAGESTGKAAMHKHGMDSVTAQGDNPLQSSQVAFNMLPGQLAQAKVTTVPVTVSMTDPQVQEQIGQIVVQQAKVGPDQIQVRVMPEGMGSLVISVSQTPGGVAVHVEANAMQTLQWLQQTANQVMDAVRASGVAVSGLGLSFGQANLGNDQAGRQAPRKDRAMDKQRLPVISGDTPLRQGLTDPMVDVTAHRISVRV